MTYTTELGNALKDFDLDKFKRFLARHVTYEYLKRGLYSHTDNWYKGLMAKMILVRTDMPEATRKKAKQTLDKLGWDYSIYETGGETKLITGETE